MASDACAASDLSCWQITHTVKCMLINCLPLLQTVNSKTDMGQLSPDEHMLLDDNKYIADVLYEVKSNKQKDLQQSRLLFKKRMFRETDEQIIEPQFVNLSYVQVCVKQVELGHTMILLLACNGLTTCSDK